MKTSTLSRFSSALHVRVRLAPMIMCTPCRTARLGPGLVEGSVGPEQERADLVVMLVADVVEERGVDPECGAYIVPAPNDAAAA